MTTASAAIEIDALIPAWETFRATTGIAPIRDEAHYQRMCGMLDALLDGLRADGFAGSIIGDVVSARAGGTRYVEERLS